MVALGFGFGQLHDGGAQTGMTNLASPTDVLEFWLGDPQSSGDLNARNEMWFRKSPGVDAEIRLRFLTLVETLSAGPLAESWAACGARTRLAAIIALDQFSRNMFRDSPRAFAHDHLALRLTKEGLTLHEDADLPETERVFFYLPLEHSEHPGDQARSVELFEALHRSARAPWQAFTRSTLDYARRHQDVIARFGRFPHRNAMVGRDTTQAEKTWLASNGGF